MTVAQTSLEAYRSLEGLLGDRQREVFLMLLRAGPTNNRILAEALGWSINRVTPRVKELRDKGLVVEVAVRPDPATGRKASVWRAV